jgi:acyl-ACP thioesterase
MDVYTKEYNVTVGNVDRNHCIKPAHVFDIFQEITTLHSEDLDGGLNIMQSAGMAWILSRFMVIIERRPEFGEVLSVSTWPRGPEKLFMLRDYIIKDKSGNIVIRARSRWLVLDIEKRRPLRIEMLPVAMPDNSDKNSVIICNSSLEKRTGLIKKCERSANYSDIDFNGHVNNARYIQWIQDSTEPELLENAKQMRIDINYLSEIKSGETVDILCAPFEQSETDPNNKIFNDSTKKFAFEGTKRTDNQSSFRAELRVNL